MNANLPERKLRNRILEKTDVAYSNGADHPHPEILTSFGKDLF